MEAIENYIEAVRHFNRFYTKWIGVVTDRYLNSPFSLTEARVLFELFQYPGITATHLRRELGLDAGYLSRILKSFERQKLVYRDRSVKDGRQIMLSLSEKGEEAFQELNVHSHGEIKVLLDTLSTKSQARLVNAMKQIEDLVIPNSTQTAYLIRYHQPGDIGWVIRQHGKLYHEEYNWDISFESLVAEIAGTFIKNYNPEKERCWIAESDGENIGSVFLVKDTENIAKLRMLIVTPEARGMGVGKRLVEECLRTARQVGYKKIRLWTVDILHAARKIYQDAGFKLIEEIPNHSFGHDLIDQTWELDIV